MPKGSSDIDQEILVFSSGLSGKNSDRIKKLLDASSGASAKTKQRYLELAKQLHGLSEAATKPKENLDKIVETLRANGHNGEQIVAALQQNMDNMCNAAFQRAEALINSPSTIVEKVINNDLKKLARLVENTKTALSDPQPKKVGKLNKALKGFIASQKQFSDDHPKLISAGKKIIRTGRKITAFGAAAAVATLGTSASVVIGGFGIAAAIGTITIADDFWAADLCQTLAELVHDTTAATYNAIAPSDEKEANAKVTPSGYDRVDGPDPTMEATVDAHATPSGYDIVDEPDPTKDVSKEPTLGSSLYETVSEAKAPTLPDNESPNAYDELTLSNPGDVPTTSKAYEVVADAETPSIDDNNAYDELTLSDPGDEPTLGGAYDTVEEKRYEQVGDKLGDNVYEQIDEPLGNKPDEPKYDTAEDLKAADAKAKNTITYEKLPPNEPKEEVTATPVKPLINPATKCSEPRDFNNKGGQKKSLLESLESMKDEMKGRLKNCSFDTVASRGPIKPQRVTFTSDTDANKTCSFDVTHDTLTTNDANVETFKAMLETYKEAHKGTDSVPDLTTNDPAHLDKIKEAVKEVYKDHPKLDEIMSGIKVQPSKPERPTIPKAEAPKVEAELTAPKLR